jgi:MinD-like ATPase involved in chromosome partitioning or flagellar assembly
MATNFENAIPDLVATSEGHSGFQDVIRACAVRDLRGRVRLVVDAPAALDLGGLSQALGQRLGSWFHGPVVSTEGAAPSERRLAHEVLQRARRWPAGWPGHWTDVTGANHTIPDRWCGFQRVLSKQAWLDAPPGKGAWTLTQGQPAIAAFYSFKGGVGRSTMLGVLAWQLARAGRKVVCIDLDVEAPGLGGLFGVQGEASVMEHLLAHTATGQAPVDDPVLSATVHGETIHVVPAGTLGRAYLEKLGRLDYLGATTAQDSPVGQALRVLLERIRGQHRPDLILLDCRAGIHDLGGLSLNDLAHVDVLIGRNTPQGRDGLALTLEVLKAHRDPPDRRILVVQTFVPLPLDGEAGRASRAEFRGAMYRACQRTLYQELDDDPDEEDSQVAHFPWPVGQLDELAACQRLADISEGTLSSRAFTDIRARLEALATPEHPAAEEGDDGVERQ